MPDPRPSATTRRRMRHLFGAYTQAVITIMVRLGYELGLWERLAEGPQTSDELSRAAHLDERPVREWLKSVAATRLVRYSASKGKFWLDPSARDVLSGEGITNLAAGSLMATAALSAWPEILRGFRGGGVPYRAYAPDFPRAVSQLNRLRYSALFISHYLPLAPGLTTRLRRGANVLDIGCGDGHVIRLLAQAFRRSRFTGCDAEALPLRWARREARRQGLTNLKFLRRRLDEIRGRGSWDVIFALDMIHDLSDPVGGLQRVRKLLAPDGWLFAVEPSLPSSLEENIGRPGAAYLYGISTLYCTMVARHGGGEALGAGWGRERALALLRDTGFTRIHSGEAPANSLSMVLTARAPSRGARVGKG